MTGWGDVGWEYCLAGSFGYLSRHLALFLRNVEVDILEKAKAFHISDATSESFVYHGARVRIHADDLVCKLNNRGLSLSRLLLLLLLGMLGMRVLLLLLLLLLLLRLLLSHCMRLLTLWDGFLCVAHLPLLLLSIHLLLLGLLISLLRRLLLRLRWLAGGSGGGGGSRRVTQHASVVRHAKLRRVA